MLKACANAGDTGAEIASRLRAAGMEVTAIDTEEAALRGLAEIGCQTIVGDATDRLVLAQADLDGAEAAVIAVTDRERTVEVARGLREANNGLRIVTWVAEPDPRLEALEVDTYWQKMANATALTGAVLRPGLFHALSDGESDLSETVLTDDALDGTMIADLGLPGGVRILLITREGSALVAEGDTVLRLRDRLTLVGDVGAMDEARRMFGAGAEHH